MRVRFISLQHIIDFLNYILYQIILYWTSYFILNLLFSLPFFGWKEIKRFIEGERTSHQFRSTLLSNPPASSEPPLGPTDKEIFIYN